MNDGERKEHRPKGMLGDYEHCRGFESRIGREISICDRDTENEMLLDSCS